MLVKINFAFGYNRFPEFVYIEVDEYDFDKYFNECDRYSWETLKNIHSRLSEHILKNYPGIRRNIDSIASIVFEKHFGTKFEM